MPTYNPYMPGVTNYQPNNYGIGSQTGGTINYQAPIFNNGILWVQGEAGAKAYPVASGSSVLLMDSENENFYIKSTDISGMPMPLRVFKYEEITKNTKDISLKKEETNTKEIDFSKFVTFDDLDKRLNSLKQQQVVKHNKRDINE